MATEPFAAKLTAIWMGALFYSALDGFRGGLKRMLSERYNNRNLWTGYLLQLILLVVFICAVA